MKHFISQRVNRVPPSGIRKFFDIAATMENVISLGIGEPDFALPLRTFETRALKSLQKWSIQVTPAIWASTNCAKPLRITSRSLYGLRYDPDSEVLITVGVSEGMYLAMTAFIDPRDEVIIPEPAYVSYAPGSRLRGGASRLRADFRSRMIFRSQQRR